MPPVLPASAGRVIGYARVSTDAPSPPPAQPKTAHQTAARRSKTYPPTGLLVSRMPHPGHTIPAPRASVVQTASLGWGRAARRADSGGPMVDQEAFREAMARLGAAVNVVTTGGAAGHGGCTASAVCSVTDDPPTLLVCLNRGGDMHRLVKANGVLCVNTLAAGQQALSPLFAGTTGKGVTERFVAGQWRPLETGAPVLEGAVVSFDCVISQVTEVGTHGVFFCAVAAIRLGSAHDEALIYFRRRYHQTGAMGREEA